MKKNQKQIRVLTYGTFDILHRGHIRLLRRAKQLGDYLIVGLSTDEFNRVKGKNSVFYYEDRAMLLKSLRMIDEVIPERTWEQKIEDVIRLGVDVFVMGSDWKGKFDFLRPYCRVVYLPRTRGISTSRVKRQVARITTI